MSTLFGILRTDTGDREIRRIDTNSEMAKFAENEFDKQYSDFFFFEKEQRKKTKFEPTWPKANPDEVLFIEDFDDTIGFSDAIKDPTSVDQFLPSEEMPMLRGVFSTLKSHNSQIIFQLIDFRHIILSTKKWWMVHKLSDKNTFIENEFNGLQLDNKITAVYDNRTLYFTNFTMASRLFDLNIYLKEANTETVISFLSQPSIETPPNPEEFANSLSTTHKKLVTSVLAYGCLKRLTPQDIQLRAINSKSKVEIHLSDNGKIIIPKDPDQRARVLRFLSNIIVPSYLDDESDYEAFATRPFKN